MIDPTDHESLATALERSPNHRVQRRMVSRDKFADPEGENSPIALKDHLKARGYRWNDGSDGRPKSWYRDIPEPDLEAEKAYLQAEIYSVPFEPHCVRMTALTRYSERV